MIISQCINPFVDGKKYQYQFCILESSDHVFVNVRFYRSNIEGLHRWSINRFVEIGEF